MKGPKLLLLCFREEFGDRKITVFQLSPEAPDPVGEATTTSDWRQQESVVPEPCPYASFQHVGSSHLPETASFCEDSTTERRERKKWTVIDDLVLISAWLNTSKDPVVGNEQKACAFWSRIAAYFAASPKVERGAKREAIQSHEIFYNDHKIKFNLHYAWEELRNDQKWCEVASRKIDGTSKKRKFDDEAQSESSQATSALGDQPTKRPPGVKAAKAASDKRSIAVDQAASEFQTMWTIKEKDMAEKERLKKMGFLESLICKKEPLSEYEEELKKKLISEMLGN
ncbi:glutathione S-transferase T3-like [Brassica napus]|uniref:glutathione S-transferase T3-like n=1 Tax=Brassica napus TaxID=3708 RepID=UPI002079A6C3|nr:glutathione S-transferase T3-like [Brassica napus]